MPLRKALVLEVDEQKQLNKSVMQWCNLSNRHNGSCIVPRMYVVAIVQPFCWTFHHWPHSSRHCCGLFCRRQDPGSRAEYWRTNPTIWYCTLFVGAGTSSLGLSLRTVPYVLQCMLPGSAASVNFGKLLFTPQNIRLNRY
jgi:hypothetical protein